MAKSAKSQTTDDTNPFAMAADMMAANPLAPKAWLDVMNESARFVQERIKHDIETQQAMLKCKTPGELMEVQNAFYQTAMQQYAEEAAKLFRMMTDAAGETAEELRKVSRRSYDDVPL